MFFFTIGFSRFDMDLTSDIPEKCVTFTIWKTHGSGKTVWNISLKIIFHHLFETFCPLKKCNDLWLTLCSFALKREVSLKKHPTWAFEKSVEKKEAWCTGLTDCVPILREQGLAMFYWNNFWLRSSRKDIAIAQQIMRPTQTAHSPETPTHVRFTCLLILGLHNMHFRSTNIIHMINANTCIINFEIWGCSLESKLPGSFNWMKKNGEHLGAETPPLRFAESTCFFFVRWYATKLEQNSIYGCFRK